MLSVLRLGFNAGYIRYYVDYQRKKDTQAIYRLNGLFVLIFCCLGTLVLLCGLALTFPRSVFSDIISAHERFVFLKSVAVPDTVVAQLANVPLLLMGFRSAGILTTTLVLSAAGFTLEGIYLVRVLHQRFIFHSFEKGLLSRLFRFTGSIIINMLVDQVNNQVDRGLLARFCGTAAVTVYSVGALFQGYYSRISSAISGIFTPRVHKLVHATAVLSRQQRVALTALFTQVGRLQFLLLSLIVSGFILFGQAFLGLWVGPGYRESYWVAVICMVPVTVPLTQNVGIEIQRAEDLHYYRSYIYGLMAIFNLISSIFLCQLRGMLIPFLAGVSIAHFAPADTWGALCGAILCYTAVYALFVWRFSMEPDERAVIMSLGRKFFRR